jgi:hypothetical protein
MRAAFLLLLFSPPAMWAQAVIAVSTQQCVWRAGDDPAWAAPNLDQSAWQPYSQWEVNSDQPRHWVRCPADLGALRGMAHPAIQVSLPATYQLYVNGRQIGGAQDLRSGNISMNTIRSFPLPQSVLASQPAVLAVRIGYSYPVLSGFIEAAPVGIRAGDRQILDALRAAEVLARVHKFLNNAFCFGILGTLGFVLLGLFLFDRSRLDLLLLSVYCLGLASIYLARFCSVTLADYPFSVDIAVYAAGTAVVILARAWIVFVLAGRRMPVLFWIPIWFVIARSAVAACSAFVPLNWSLGLAAIVAWTGHPFHYASLFCSVAPFVAFWPYHRIRRPMIPLAALCMAWGAFMTVFFLSGAATLGVRLSTWASFMVSAELFVSLCVIVALMGLLFRQHRRVNLERAELAGEMASAREIQQYLIPEKLPPTPGLAIESVYVPSLDVGGDFFQVLPDARDGSTLIVVGDVAGKGLQAGMLSALIVGAIRTAFQFTSEPGEILALLNQRLQGRGLVTCLALRIHLDGSMELTNAGHLPPYINGKEMALQGNLPLGAAPGIAFETMRMQLAPADSILLISDGVVEARTKSGELFGFERARQISTGSAQQIAKTAQAFGQEDDITVLTIRRLAVRTAAKTGEIAAAGAVS